MKRSLALDKLPIDKVDLASGPIFIITMLAEARALRNRPLRELGDLDHWTKEELADPSLPPDELIPVGYERRDTAASLTMLVGNVAVNAGLLRRPRPRSTGSSSVIAWPTIGKRRRVRSSSRW